MKKITSLVLSAVLLSSIVGCGKSNPTDNKAVSDTTSANQKNSQAVVPAGTTLDTVLQEDLSTGKNQNNSRFTLQVNKGNPLVKDAQIQGHLENVVKAAKGTKASLHLVIDDIVLKNGSTYPIEASLVDTKIETKTKGKFLQNVGIILGGAVAGHFLGNKANFKHGGLAGTAAATAFVLSSPGGEVVLNKGTNIDLKLTKPLDTN